ncbi:unnamed protein product, partial [Brenthis ino]
MSLDTQNQTIVNLTARLLDEEASLNVEEENETALLVAKQSTKKRNIPLIKTHNELNEKSHRFICYNCGKRGHYARDCQAPKQNHKQQSERNMLAFNVANTDLKNNDEGLRWILDSGASAHMSYKRENFVELYEYTGSPLKLGNQEALEVIGQGNILIDKCVNGQWETKLKQNKAQIFICDDDDEQNAEVLIDNTENNTSEQNCGSDDSTHTTYDDSDETYEPSQEIDLANIDRSNVTLRPRRNNYFYEANLIELDVPTTYNEAINSKEYLPYSVESVVLNGDSRPKALHFCKPVFLRTDRVPEVTLQYLYGTRTTL